MRIHWIALVGALSWAGCDMAGSQEKDGRAGQMLGTCTASCCSNAGGCENVDPYVDQLCADGGKYAAPDGSNTFIVASGPLMLDGVHVGGVELRYSLRCNAWWTQTRRFPTDNTWYANNYEIAAAFSSESRRNFCNEGNQDGTYHDDGQTTYGCAAPDLVYNNTTTNSSVQACGWLRLKRSSDPIGEVTAPIENCGLGEGCGSNRDPVCNRAVPSEATVYAEDHAMKKICIGNLSDPDNNLLDANGEINLTFPELVSNESENGLGDGETVPDIRVSSEDEDCVDIRAERQGPLQTARVYTIGFTATDTCGASCDGSVNVTVLFSHGNGGQNPKK